MWSGTSHSLSFYPCPPVVNHKCAPCFARLSATSNASSAWPSPNFAARGLTRTVPALHAAWTCDIRDNLMNCPFLSPHGFRHAFHREHEKAYGYAYPERPLEIVNLRLRLVIPTPKSRGRTRKTGPAGQAREALIKTTPVWFGSKPHPAGIYERQRLAAGAGLRGPAVIFEYSATTVVPPNFACKVDKYLNLVIYHDAR